MKRKFSILALFAVFMASLALMVACGGDIIPDPTPNPGGGEEEKAEKFEVYFDDENLDGIFVEDDQSSIEMEVKDSQATFSIIGGGYDNSNYGSYWFYPTLNVTQYPYLVFDIAELTSTFEVKIAYTETTLIDTNLTSGLAVCDLSELPNQYQSNSIKIHLSMFITGNQPNGDKLVLNGVYQTDVKPDVPDSGQVEKYFDSEEDLDVFDTLTGVEAKVSDGQAVLTRSGSDADAGTAQMDFNLNTVNYKYLVIDIASATSAASKLEIVSEDSLNGYVVDTEFTTGRKLYLDFATMKSSLKGTSIPISLKFTVDGTVAAADNIVLNGIYQTNSEAPEAAAEDVVWGDITLKNPENVAVTLLGGGKVSVRPLLSEGQGSIVFDTKIDFTNYRYLVFDVALPGAEAEISIQYNGANYPVLNKGVTNGGKIIYDVNNLPSAAKQGETTVQVTVKVGGGYGEFVLSGVYLANLAGTQTSLVNKDNYTSMITTDGSMEVGVDGDNLVFTVVKGDPTYGSGQVFVDATINTAQNRYMIIDVKSGSKFGMRIEYKGINYMFAEDLSYSNGAVLVYDLTRLPEEYVGASSEISVKFYGYVGTPAIIGGIYLANELTTEAVPVEPVDPEAPKYENTFDNAATDGSVFTSPIDTAYKIENGQAVIYRQGKRALLYAARAQCCAHERA